MLCIIGIELRPAHDQRRSAPVERVLVEVVGPAAALAGALVAGQRIAGALLAQHQHLDLRLALEPRFEALPQVRGGEVETACAAAGAAAAGGLAALAAPAGGVPALQGP